MFGLNIFGGPKPVRRDAGEGGRGAWTFCPEPVGPAAGLVAGTLVATAMGWRPAESIVEGDLVLTFDHGLQPVRAVARDRQWAEAGAVPRAVWPLVVPAGALGNSAPMTLMPEQAVMLESDSAELLYGDPFALIEAARLDGVRGIERAYPTEARDVVALYFDQSEIVYAQGGALAFCPSRHDTNIGGLLDELHETGYRTLPSDEANMLVECLVAEDSAAGAPGVPAAFFDRPKGGRPVPV